MTFHIIKLRVKTPVKKPSTPARDCKIANSSEFVTFQGLHAVPGTRVPAFQVPIEKTMI